MSKPLTAMAVAKLKHAEARREIPDASCPGLYLVIQPTGGKSWALRFRRPDGRPAKLVIGAVYVKPPDAREPDVPPAIGGYHSLAAARRLVAGLKHEIAMGRDPAAAHIREKRDRRSALALAAASTFAASAHDYVEQYASKRVRRWHELSRILGIDPETLAPFPGGLADRWAERPVAAIDGHDIHRGR